MKTRSEQFAIYCDEHFDMKNKRTPNYHSLPICIIDCVYSLRAKYKTITLPIVQRYADAFMNGDPNSSGDTISQFIQNIDEIGGTEEFTEQIIKNHQKLGGLNKIPKADVCYQLARYLNLLHIDTIEDFQSFESQELLEVVIHAVKGMGNAGTNYLFMLTGDSSRCKPDVHLHRCVEDACGCKLNDDEIQTLFEEAIQFLHKKYPDLTVRDLDSIIWEVYQQR